jgi:pyrimidine operon attenuation protein/uracil phosphoribosyltransferase
MVALLALRETPKPVVGVGIGWGGIELPIAYRQLACLKGEAPPEVFAAHYSTYKKTGSKVPAVRPVASTAAAELAGKQVVLFDDNSLSGRTIQTVLEFLVAEKGAHAVRVFITRLSGERRYDQMRMKNHGALNPDLVGDVVRGYVGETPFARAWSREDYTNPIGVFSLARRRILELLFANSSADRFDREGF